MRWLRSYIDMIHLDKINSEFRYLVDLFCFTDRTDIELSNFYILLQENKEEHLSYFIDRFIKTAEIFWRDGNKFWYNRLSFLYSLNDKFISKYLDSFFERRMLALLRCGYDISPVYNVQYLQFIEYCRVKSDRKANLVKLKNTIITYSSQIKIERLIKLLEHLIPVLYKNTDEYVSLLTESLFQCAFNFKILLGLEKNNIRYNKQAILHLMMNMLSSRSYSDKNIRAFFIIMDDSYILDNIKSFYNDNMRESIVELASKTSLILLEEDYFANIKKLIKLDSELATEVVKSYIDKIYRKPSSHKKANVNKILRVLKLFPEVSVKKIIGHMATTNKVIDIKPILDMYPEYNRLSLLI